MIKSNPDFINVSAPSVNANFSIIEKQAYTYVPINISRSSGKYYWEVVVTGLRTHLGWVPESMLPLSSYNEPINNSSFVNANTWCVIANANGLIGGIRGVTQGQIYSKNILINTLSTSGPGTYGFAIDIANGKLWVSFNGVYHNSGDPVAGTNPTISTTAFVLGRPLVYIDNYDGGTGNIVGKFAASVLTVPSGYSSWL